MREPETNDSEVRMPTFEDLPRELCQEILKIVFHETVTADLKFSLNIRKYICFEDHTSQLRDDLPECLRSARNDEAGASRFHPGYLPAMHAPSTGTTATALREVFPDIADDIRFVLEKSLHKFEQRLVEKVESYTERDGEDFDEMDATAKYGCRASDKGEMCD